MEPPGIPSVLEEDKDDDIVTKNMTVFNAMDYMGIWAIKALRITK